MFACEQITTGPNGHLYIEKVDTLDLAAHYGTPLYVMSKTQIVENCRRYQDSIEKYYGGNGLVLYASKAFCCKEICRMMNDAGMGLDIVSGGELYTAKSVQFPPERIYFHGNNKTDEEIVAAMEYGVGYLVADNVEEIECIGRIARATNTKQKVLLRIKPGVDAHTHDYIRTGQIDSKFGFALETGEAMKAVKQAAGIDSIELVGIHCHIGSQIFETDPFVFAARIMIGFMAQVKKETGLTLALLNLGGGYGIKYLPKDDPPAYDEYMKSMSGAIHEVCDLLDFAVPRILLEPGRSIVGAAGVTLYTVGSVKTIPGVRTYVAVDGGMTDNPRYALYQARYEIVNAGLADAEKTMEITLAGRCCESGDLIGEKLRVQNLQKGDVVAVLSTGAYNYSMASHYNRVPNPAVVMVDGDAHKEIVKREKWEDLARNDV